MIDYEIYHLLIFISEHEKNLKEPKPYLFANVNDDIVNAYEEFLFADENIEDTVLYKHIEALKKQPIFLETVQESINALEERRQYNQHLKRIPTFTVWKILTYVKDKNSDNAIVLDALERYYNIDRYMLTGINWESGYKLLPADYESGKEPSQFTNSTLIGESNIGGQYSAVIFDYQGNVFEKEDNYSAYDWSMDFEQQPLNNYAKTNFMAALANMPMLSEELKSRVIKNCSEIRNVKTECKLCYVPHDDIHKYDADRNATLYHYENIKYKKSGNTATEWDHYDEYEVDLYFAIDAMGGHIWSCRHNMAHGRIPEIDLTEEQYALEYMVYQTTKFGVELEEPAIDKHITSTPSYWAWFRFYDNHFKNVLTDKQWNAFEEARRNGQDTSAFMPSGHWTDLLEKTETLTKKK